MTEESTDGSTVPSPPVEALAGHTTPLGTTDPLEPFPDADGLDEILGDARVIGLGEATHGTREFFRLKHRLIRYLVREHGLRTVALEANLPETLAIDEYVAHGRGDPRDALDGIYFWTWNVEAVLGLVEWLRSFNEGRPLADRVRFHGIDIQYTTGAVQRLRGYFEQVDAEIPERIAVALETVDDDGVNPDRDERTDERHAAGERVAAAVRDHLDDHREAYVDRAGERAWGLARRQTAVIEAATTYRKARVDHTGDDPEQAARLLRLRDRAMAENVTWLLEFEDTDRIAVWGHDAHVNRSKQEMRDSDVSSTPMGGYLADRYGEAYLAVGFACGRGSFQALGETDDGEYELMAHTVDGPRPGTVDATLDTLDASPVLFDVRGAREDSRLADWVETPRGTFSAGATYDPDSPERYITEYSLAAAFDAVCYVAETTRARPVGDG
ncbi:MAG: erythromycin esterase related protein [halophilic archaeon J07HX64]|jgi:Erythromycin esterase homolog|nr:MAG: erythromycin esterase related protein [halophilic archaeon J07HX64]